MTSHPRWHDKGAVQIKVERNTPNDGLRSSGVEGLKLNVQLELCFLPILGETLI